MQTVFFGNDLSFASCRKGIGIENKRVQPPLNPEAVGLSVIRNLG